jgi:choline dehydrogenase
VRPVDLVVVGGGTAGCVIAARASEDPGRRVLLVEAGPDPRPLPDVVSDPARQQELVLESPYIRMYDVQRPSDGSRFPLLSGRILGGGSSVNNMSVIRPTRRDCDGWARFGGEAWSYEALLPLMRAIESDPDFGPSDLHGDRGPLHLHRSFRLEATPDDPRLAALVDASADFGLPRCDDLNVPDPIGVAASPYNIRDGRRQSTAVAWLEPARERENLQILADTLATRILLDGDRAVGVEVETPSGRVTIEAGEVVIAAGVYHSPQLLLLSGIGPPGHLEDVGVTVRHPLEGVGRNYQDHAVVYMTFQSPVDGREDYAIPKVRLIARSDARLDHADLHVFMRPTIRMPGMPGLLPWSIHLLEHRSPGRVRLVSADPAALPLVEPQLLEHPEDVAAMIGGMRFVADLAGHPRLQPYFGDLIQPERDEDAAAYARRTFTTYHHGVGTCRLGDETDELAVVDPELRVRGIGNLRVADASVLPVVPHANTNVSAILAAEVAARALRATASVR